VVGIQWEGLGGRHSVGGAGSKAFTGRGWVIGRTHICIVGGGWVIFIQWGSGLYIGRPHVSLFSGRGWVTGRTQFSGRGWVIIRKQRTLVSVQWEVGTTTTQFTTMAAHKNEYDIP